MEIAEIKSRLPVVAVLARYGLAPDGSGRMRCPFHDDRTPSFQVYPDAWHCFAAACADRPHGDVIDFIERQERCSKREALVTATAWAEGKPVAVAATNGTASRAPSAPKPAVDVSSSRPCGAETRRAVLGVVFDRFRKSYGASKTARAYLGSRGLDGEAMGAGYNSGRWVESETDTMRAHAEALGLILPGGRAFARSCVVLPLVDSGGAPVSLYGRSVRSGARAKHFYLRDRQGLFPAYPPPETARLVLAESPLDAASLAGVDLGGAAVLALYGTNGLTPEHRAAITALPSLDEIVLFLDGDEAGRTATETLAATLHALCPGVTISAARTPENQDVNGLLVADGPARLAALVAERATVHRPSLESVPGAATAEVVGHLDTGNPDALRFHAPPLVLTVLGGVKLTGLDRLRVTLKTERTQGRHALALRHNLDLYHAAQVEALTDRAAERFDVERSAMRRVLDALTDSLEGYRLGKVEAMQAPKSEAPVVSAEAEAEARAYLAAPDLMERTGRDIGRSGVVGEETNRLLMYLAFTSRLRPRPLQVVALAASGTGKTYLQDAVGRLIPDEERLEITALSENALYYFGRTELRHKLVLIEDLDGAEDVLYPLRELQSKGRLTKTVALKDARGRIKTETVTVEGPVCVAGCTTRERLYDDNAGRVLLLHLDQSDEQNQGILTYQKKRSAGAVDETGQERVRRLFQNAQRLLAPVSIRNPYAERLSLPPGVAQERRANQLYLDVVEAVAFYHQHQRPVQTDGETGEQYVEATLDDVEAANALMGAALTTKADELTGACRRFLDAVRSWSAEHERTSFYAGEVRAALGLHPTSLKRYLWQLRDFGYAEVVGGSRYRKGFEYRLTAIGQTEGRGAAVERFLSDRLAELRAEASAS